MGVGEEKSMRNRQIDIKKTKQVRINAKVHQQLKIAASRKGKSIKNFIEELLEEIGVGDNK